MKISSRGIKLIVGYEGFSPKPYTCAGGKVTIGLGHKILPTERFTELTFVAAEELLKKDVEIAERGIERLVKKPINQLMFDALVSFVFNIGIGNFNKSSVLLFLNAGDYYRSALSFHLWNKAGGNFSNGLIKRRAEEVLLFIIGAIKLGKIK